MYFQGWLVKNLFGLSQFKENLHGNGFPWKQWFNMYHFPKFNHGCINVDLFTLIKKRSCADFSQILPKFEGSETAVHWHSTNDLKIFKAAIRKLFHVECVMFVTSLRIWSTKRFQQFWWSQSSLHHFLIWSYCHWKIKSLNLILSCNYFKGNLVHSVGTRFLQEKKSYKKSHVMWILTENQICQEVIMDFWLYLQNSDHNYS